MFPLAYPVQVILFDERIGAIPYLLLALTAVRPFLRWLTVRQVQRGQALSGMDCAVGALLAFSTVQIVVGYLLLGYDAAATARLLLIFAGSGWVYYYVSRFASIKDLRGVLWVLAITAVVVGVDWGYETYAKTALGHVRGFQLKAQEYSIARLGIAADSANTSRIGIQYRAAGLLESYPLTGATVAVGAFALVALFPDLRTRRRLKIQAFFLAMLTIGQATTAWIAYVLTVCFGLYVSGSRAWLVRLAKFALYGVATVLAVLFAGSYFELSRPLVTRVIGTATAQLASVLNVDSSGASLSWFWLYADNLTLYAAIPLLRPWALLVGQGPQPFGTTAFGRGGDTALLEVFAMYGIPMAIVFFGLCATAIIRALRLLRRRDVPAMARAHVMFGVCVIVFLLISLTHYDILFKKSMLVCFYLALGVVRRSTSIGRRVPGQPPLAVAGGTA